MSSAAYLNLDPSRKASHEEAWADFAEEANVVHSPNTVGGRTWYLEADPSGVEVQLNLG